MHQATQVSVWLRPAHARRVLKSVQVLCESRPCHCMRCHKPGHVCSLSRGVKSPGCRKCSSGVKLLPCSSTCSRAYASLASAYLSAACSAADLAVCGTHIHAQEQLGEGLAMVCCRSCTMKHACKPHKTTNTAPTKESQGWAGCCCQVQPPQTSYTNNTPPQPSLWLLNCCSAQHCGFLEPQAWPHLCSLLLAVGFLPQHLDAGCILCVGASSSLACALEAVKRLQQEAGRMHVCSCVLPEQQLVRGVAEQVGAS